MLGPMQVCDVPDGVVHKSWALTVNNWTPQQLENMKLWEVTRAVFAEEVGDTGTPHLQCCITFKAAKRWAAVRKLCAVGHWSVVINLESAWDYCFKDGNVTHVVDNRAAATGTSQQGKRKDLDLAYEAASKRMPFAEFVREVRPGFQALKSYAMMQKAFIEPRKYREDIGGYAPIEVVWLYGPTGTGKSRFAHSEWGRDGDMHIAGDNSKWWDGYVSHSTVLVDDVRHDWCSFKRLLQLTDIYPFDVEIKGGTTPAVWKRIVFSSPYHFRDMYAACGEDIKQFARRVTEIRHFPVGCPVGGVVQADRPEPVLAGNLYPAHFAANGGAGAGGE